jgi:hypothetical protein
MSLIDPSTPPSAPLLVSGQRLDRATFHDRYEQTAPDFRAELIGGVVYLRGRVDLAHGQMRHSSRGWPRRGNVMSKEGLDHEPCSAS